MSPWPNRVPVRTEPTEMPGLGQWPAAREQKEMEVSRDPPSTLGPVPPAPPPLRPPQPLQAPWSPWVWIRHLKEGQVFRAQWPRWPAKHPSPSPGTQPAPIPHPGRRQQRSPPPEGTSAPPGPQRVITTHTPARPKLKRWAIRVWLGSSVG